MESNRKGIDTKRVKIDSVSFFHYSDPDNQSIQRDLKNYAVKLKTIPADQRTLTLQLPEEEQKKEHYEALCRGDIKRVGT